MENPRKSMANKSQGYSTIRDRSRTFTTIGNSCVYRCISHGICCSSLCKTRYVPSRFNPADIASKGYMSPTQLANSEQWWTGPQWLKDDESTWPQWENNIYHEHEE
ncbi:unnamed protein product, partial [Onchocerca ochengi]|uniref:ORF3 n=1 Tax=Onchocerca ochengi TaxID=42157 RepID=A0A182EZ89_ONCOC